MEFCKGPQASVLVKAVPFKVLSVDSYSVQWGKCKKRGGKNDKKEERRKKQEKSNWKNKWKCLQIL